MTYLISNQVEGKFMKSLLLWLVGYLVGWLVL